MVWFSLIPLLFACITFISCVVRSYKGHVSNDTEITSVLWFILAVLIYGVFK
jgi:hypothetical protein